jgi:hypothetical protein
MDSIHGPEYLCHLIMDIYPVHLMPSVKRRTLLLSFQVHFIPAGLTYQYHPLDRAVFGCLKATVRSLYSRFVHDAAGGSATKRKVVEILQESEQKLSGASSRSYRRFSKSKRRRKHLENPEKDEEGAMILQRQASLCMDRPPLRTLPATKLR